MSLKELIEKLRAKPNQKSEVEFLVYEKDSGDMVCCDLTGTTTTELMKVLSKRRTARPPQREEAKVPPS